METVCSLADYIEKIISVNTMTVYSSSLNSLALYRGQADVSWGLVPKVFRDNRFQNENALVNEFERVCPEEFHGLSYIEKLIKMQHYGLPTRLLDFSENPLVALYFACDSNENIDKDGVVYSLGGFPVFNQDDPRIALLSKVVFERGSRINIADFISSLPIELQIYHTGFTEDDIVKILTHPAIGIRPKLYNQRIRLQSGAFLMFGADFKEKVGNIYHFEEKKPCKLEDIWQYGRTYVIPADKKVHILGELDRVGINKSTIYPELEHVAQYIDEHIAKNNFTHMGSL